jgi:predicted phage-related endonuclease
MATTTVTSKVVTEVATERKAVELSKDIADVIGEFVTTRDLLNSLEKSKKELEAKIREALGDAEVGVFDGKVRIEVNPRKRTGVDTKALAEAFPEAYEATQTLTEYSVLVVK